MKKRTGALPFLMKPLIFYSLTLFIYPFQYQPHILTLLLCPQQSNRQARAGASEEEEKKTEIKRIERLKLEMDGTMRGYPRRDKGGVMKLQMNLKDCIYLQTFPNTLMSPLFCEGYRQKERKNGPQTIDWDSFVCVN